MKIYLDLEPMLDKNALPWPGLDFSWRSTSSPSGIDEPVLPCPDLAYNVINQTITAVNTHQ